MAQPLYCYEAEVEWTGQRKGQLRSRSLLSIEVGAPPEFQGHEGIWTPEHFFVGSVASCYMTTFVAIAELSKLDFISFRCAARASLEKLEGQGYQVTKITLAPTVVLRNERDHDRASRILEKAEKNCFISNSIKSEVVLEPTVLFAAAAEAR